jgi:hypothetical protein
MMAFKVILDDGRQDVVTVSQRLWLTADRDRVVADGDPEAAFLLVVAGGELDRSEAEWLGLVSAEPAADDEAGGEAGGGLDAMKVADLRQLADELGVDHAGLKKAELVEALEAATKAASSDDDGDAGDGGAAA